MKPTRSNGHLIPFPTRSARVTCGGFAASVLLRVNSVPGHSKDGQAAGRTGGRGRAVSSTRRMDASHLSQGLVLRRKCGGR